MLTEDRPPKYAIDTENNLMRLLAMGNGERELVQSPNNLVNFENTIENTDTIGGREVHQLFLKEGQEYIGGGFITLSDGYEMPSFDVSMEQRARIRSRNGRGIDHQQLGNDTTEIQLPPQTVTTEKRIVTNQRVEIDSDLGLEPGRKIERNEEEINVTPFISLAYHPNLDIASGRPPTQDRP